MVHHLIDPQLLLDVLALWTVCVSTTVIRIDRLSTIFTFNLMPAEDKVFDSLLYALALSVFYNWAGSFGCMLLRIVG